MTTEQPTDSALLEVAEQIARIAGAVARDAFTSWGASQPAFDEKRDYTDIVTETDREVERLVSERLRSIVPGSAVIGEEFGQRGDGEPSWYVDPIDGTANFASGLPFYSVSIGAAQEGRLVAGVVYDPERDELFSATASTAALNGRPLQLPNVELHDARCELMTSLPFEVPGGPADAASMDAFAAWLSSFRAVRRFGSCALHLAYVAAGRIAVCAERRVSPWDVAAGIRLVHSAGGVTVAWDRQGNEVDALSRPDDVYSIVAHAPGFSLSLSALSTFVQLAKNPA